MDKKSFMDYMIKDGDRIAEWIARNESKGLDAYDFGTFVNVFENSEIGQNFIDGQRKNNVSIDDDGLRLLFEKSCTQQAIKRNLGEEEYNRQVNLAKAISGQTKLGIVSEKPKISPTKAKTPSYKPSNTFKQRSRTGKEYARQVLRFNPQESMHIKSLSARYRTGKITGKQAVAEFNSKYPDRKRSFGSITRKLYR